MFRRSLIFMMFVSLLFSQEEKRYSFELNPITLVASITEKNNRLSMGYNYFIPSINSMIHIPIFYGNTSGSAPFNGNLISNVSDEKVFTIDLAYCYFLNKKDTGMYLQGSTRIAKLWGGFMDKSTTKLGIGFGIGDMGSIFGSNFYYNMSIVGTRYFTGENGIFYNSGFASDDNPSILEFNFSIGYRF